MKQLNVGLPDELHQAVKIKAARDGTSISKIVVGLLEVWVAGAGMTVTYAIEEQHMEGDVRVVDKVKVHKAEPVTVDDQTTFKTTGKTYSAVHPTGTARGQTDAVSKVTHPKVPPTVKAGQVKDFSKSAQVKGKMGR